MNNHEVAINGVKIVEKILNIPVPHISFFDPSEISNNEITGMYLFESDEIIFNEEWIEKSQSIEIDAIGFTHHKIYELFGVKTFLSKSIKDSI